MTVFSVIEAPHCRYLAGFLEHVIRDARIRNPFDRGCSSNGRYSRSIGLTVGIPFLRVHFLRVRDIAGVRHLCPFRIQTAIPRTLRKQQADGNHDLCAAATVAVYSEFVVDVACLRHARRFAYECPFCALPEIQRVTKERLPISTADKGISVRPTLSSHKVVTICHVLLMATDIARKPSLRTNPGCHFSQILAP